MRARERKTIKGVKEQAEFCYKRREKEDTAKNKELNLGINVIKCCIFIAHSKGEYINGNYCETTAMS